MWKCGMRSVLLLLVWCLVFESWVCACYYFVGACLVGAWTLLTCCCFGQFWMLLESFLVKGEMLMSSHFVWKIFTVMWLSSNTLHHLVGLTYLCPATHHAAKFCGYWERDGIFKCYHSCWAAFFCVSGSFWAEDAGSRSDQSSSLRMEVMSEWWMA